MNWSEKVTLTMSRTGKTYYEVCREIGRHGGLKAAQKKRNLKKFHEDQIRRKLDVEDSAFTPQDIHNIHQNKKTNQELIQRLYRE